ncbi:MAG TPA: lipase maturation factor family protein [Polyangia bacterium]|nr:lipase maturation factor family protein [Polyangia bacterium]
MRRSISTDFFDNPDREREPAAVEPPWWHPLRSDSGPWVARLFHRLLALIFLCAWVSLGVQVRVLIGARGLLPVEDVFAAARADPASLTFADFPTLLWLTHNDAALVMGTFIGAALAVLAAAGIRTRLCFALSTILYLSYATACRLFLSFQWDNLLLECGFLAVFLPADQPKPAIHFLFRALLFKLYFESGIAKGQSPLHDWWDGSAMTYYYETAPLPTPLAWTAHYLPLWWHHLESRATLALELVVPLGIFGPRRIRWATAIALTIFQIVNAATANYGFFCYLALALNVFLLDDPAREREQQALIPAPAQWRGLLGGAFAAAVVFVSLIEALFHFTDPGPVLAPFSRLIDVAQRVRIVNTYHLFGAITRERIEPEFQTLEAGHDAGDENAWRAQDLRFKPGDPNRQPPIVAPHQPRVDFQLWFHGLSFQHRPPSYVAVLQERMCEDGPAVQSLFRFPLPPHPAAVRVVYWRYHFTTPDQAQTQPTTKTWWRRERVAAAAPVTCPHATP